MMSGLSGRLKRFYFAPGDSLSLGVNRFLICTLVLYVYFFYRGNHASFWSEVPDVYWMPIHAFRWLSIPRLPAAWLDLLDAVWFVSLVCAALGIATRCSSLVAFLCGAYLISLPQNFGKVDTSDGPVVLMLLILAASPCGDAFSLDAIRRGVSWTGNTRSPAYGWPNKAGQILFVCVFGAAGFSKLHHSGLAWMTAENMSNILLQVHYTGLPAGRVGLRLAEMPFACWAMAVATVVCEASAPLALFTARIRVVVIPTLFGMLIGFKLCLGHWPIYLLPMFGFWIPWHRLLHLRAPLGANRASPD